MRTVRGVKSSEIVRSDAQQKPYNEVGAMLANLVFGCGHAEVKVIAL